MIFKAVLLVTLSLTLIFVERGYAAIQCAGIFVPSAKSSAENLESIEAAIVALAKLRLDIDLARVQGTSTLVLTTMGSHFSKKEAALWDYLDQYSLMSRSDFEAKIKKHIVELQAALPKQKPLKEVQRDQKVRAQEDRAHLLDLKGESAVLHRIKPGSFRMGHDLGLIFNRGLKVTITKPFDMMSTQTTQELWRKVTSLANLRFPGRYNIWEDPSFNKGDLHPVENVSYDNVIEWLHALNELSKQGDPLLAQFIRDHKDGDVYRLPTEAERQFVARGRGKYHTNYHFGKDDTRFGYFGWNDTNSSGDTQAVAQKKPLLIDGKDFYDMHGNAGEWLHDWWSDDLVGGKDPQGPATGQKRVFHQGSGDWWESLAMTAGGRSAQDPNIASSAIGFRFVREVRP